MVGHHDPPKPLATMKLEFRDDSARVVARFWTEAVPKFGLQLWYCHMEVIQKGTNRIVQFEIPDVPAPGSWNHLTARFFAAYPDVDRYGESFTPEVDEIKALLASNFGD